MRVEKSYCRLCFGYCGMDVTIDDNDRIVSIRGDHDNPVTQGYACVKGLEAHHGMYGPTRILRPMKRVDGKFTSIPLEQALDEIAARIKAIIDEDGAQAMAFFRGTGSMCSTIGAITFPTLADAVGGQRFSTMTIDQSAKWVTADRLGTWAAGRQPFEGSDVWLFAGANPLVSVFSWHTPAQNPMKALKRARDNGTKIIVIDPRECEMAKFADIHLQIYPGEDAAVAACLLNVVLSHGWEDKVFCDQHVAGMDALRAAIAPFAPELVAARAGVAAGDLIAAADLFARQSKRGGISTGTGVDMARFPNLAEHLYDVLGVVCGRFLREGDALPNPGVLFDKRPPRAEAKSPERGFEKGPRSRVRGAVRLRGESATPTLAEEILTPGPGRVHGVLLSGANPINAIPDQDKVVQAFRALDFLAVIEPFMTETAQMADYVLPPKIQYENADFTFGLEMSNLAMPYAQYTPPLVSPPADSELCEEGYVVWALAKRLGVTLKVMGVELDMEKAPSEADFLRLIGRKAAMPFDEVTRAAQGGKLFDLPAKTVQGASEKAGRFTVMPDDVAAELRAFLQTESTAAVLAKAPEFNLRLIARRMREVSNTSCRDFPTARARTPYNPLCVHPDDLAAQGVANGARVEVVSAHGRIPAIVKADATLKRGVVSMTHGFGAAPGEDAPYEVRGASISLLISLDHDFEPLQAMPLMSGVPVRIERAA